MVNINNTVLTKEQKLIKENEIMGKILLEIILKYKEKQYPSEIKTDEQIAELLNGEDWKERNGFSVKEDGKIGWREVHWYAMKPQEIVKELNYKNKISKMVNAKLAEEVVDKEVKINDLEKELKEKEVLIEDLEAELEEADEIIASHEEALVKAKEWRLREEKNLKEKIEEQRDLVFTFTRSLVIKEREFDKLSESHDEEHEKLRKEIKKNTVKDEKIKDLEWKLYLANKSLPNLPKKSSKLKCLKNKITLKSQQLIEKVKHQSQELFARIEIKTK